MVFAKTGWIIKRIEQSEKFGFKFKELEADESLMADIKANGIKVQIKLLARGDGSLEVRHGIHRLVIAVKIGLEMIPVEITNEGVV